MTHTHIGYNCEMLINIPACSPCERFASRTDIFWQTLFIIKQTCNIWYQQRILCVSYSVLLPSINQGQHWFKFCWTSVCMLFFSNNFLMRVVSWIWKGFQWRAPRGKRQTGSGRFTNCRVDRHPTKPVWETPLPAFSYHTCPGRGSRVHLLTQPGWKLLNLMDWG